MVPRHDKPSFARALITPIVKVGAARAELRELCRARLDEDLIGLNRHGQERRRGIATALMRDAERRLRLLGCPKINLQVRQENAEVQAFYATLGFKDDSVLSLGKRLEDD